MSYTKNTWETGDTITAAKLNHMEDGIDNAGTLFVTITQNADDSYTADRTFTEIKANYLNAPVIVKYDNGISVIFIRLEAWLPEIGNTKEGFVFRQIDGSIFKILSDDSVVFEEDEVT